MVVVGWLRAPGRVACDCLEPRGRYDCDCEEEKDVDLLFLDLKNKLTDAVTRLWGRCAHAPRREGQGEQESLGARAPRCNACVRACITAACQQEMMLLAWRV